VAVTRSKVIYQLGSREREREKERERKKEKKRKEKKEKERKIDRCTQETICRS
jgi:hypothetical protein